MYIFYLEQTLQALFTKSSMATFRRRDSENVEEKKDSHNNDPLSYLKLSGSKDKDRKETPDKFRFKSSKQIGTPEPSASLSAEARDRHSKTSFLLSSLTGALCPS